MTDKVTEISTGPMPLVSKAGISMRVSAHSYFAALLLGTFYSAMMFYLAWDALGILLFALSWVLMPILALNDKLVFDGKLIKRLGYLPRFWSRLAFRRIDLKIKDVEQVETHSLR